MKSCVLFFFIITSSSSVFAMGSKRVTSVNNGQFAIVCKAKALGLGENGQCQQTIHVKQGLLTERCFGKTYSEPTSNYKIDSEIHYLGNGIADVTITGELILDKIQKDFNKRESGTMSLLIGAIPLKTNNKVKAHYESKTIDIDGFTVTVNSKYPFEPECEFVEYNR